MNEENTKKWYKKTWVIILFLIVFFPVGLVLMWKYSSWNKYVKIAISALIALLFIIGIASPSDSGDVAAGNSSEVEESSCEEYISTVVAETTEETTTHAETTTEAETTTSAETTAKAPVTTTKAAVTTNAVTTTMAPATTTMETTTKEVTTAETTTAETTTATSIGRTVYITPKGERYHYDPDCGGKNSYEVTIDNVGGRTPCKKCVH